MAILALLFERIRQAVTKHFAPKERFTLKPEVESSDKLGPLVVLFHGYTNHAKDMDGIGGLVIKSLDGAIVKKPEMPLSRWSTADPLEVVLFLLKYINDAWHANGKPDDIIFIGHSVGGLLARKVYVAACGPTEDAPFSDVLNIKEPQPWAAHVKRIILLAGMNRGWEISYHFSAKKAIQWTIGVWIGNVIGLVGRRLPFMLHMRRGASFITQLRLQWIAMKKYVNSRGMGGALTVQLLGSTDDTVSPEDNVDLVSGRDFIYLDVPDTGHDDIIHVDPGYIEEDGRSGILRDAIKLPPRDLKSRAASISDQPLPKANQKVDEVIFVVHGIRDVGYWTQKIARRVIARARKLDKDNQSPDKPRERVFAMETASYGYFAMAPFLFASRRRQKVEWLMDQYAEAMANYPDAKFSCIAHSNGTYLVAKALEEYAACRFKRIVFAGSVVRQSFQWNQYITSGRVHAVLNYVATGDWVVAFFPKLFEFFRIQDLGSAGFDGFTGQHQASLWQVRYVKGGHGAALTEEHWDDIADFIVNPVQGSNPLPQPLPQPEAHDQNDWVKEASQSPATIWGFIFVVVSLIGLAIAWLPHNPVIGTAGVLIYVKLIWEILTRV